MSGTSARAADRSRTRASVMANLGVSNAGRSGVRLTTVGNFYNAPTLVMMIAQQGSTATRVTGWVDLRHGRAGRDGHWHTPCNRSTRPAGHGNAGGESATDATAEPSPRRSQPPTRLPHRIGGRPLPPGAGRRERDSPLSPTCPPTCRDSSQDLLPPGTPPPPRRGALAFSPDRGPRSGRKQHSVRHRCGYSWRCRQATLS
jgi:hypothetical protein